MEHLNAADVLQTGNIEKKKNSLDGASVYSNMNYQKLADAYGRRYIAEKAKEKAVKEYDRQCKSFDNVKLDYTIVDDILSIKPGDIIESIPNDLSSCLNVKLSMFMQEYCDYHLKYDAFTEKYYAFKDLNDPEYPNRFKYLGSFDKLENANRALLEDRNTSSKFSIE